MKCFPLSKCNAETSKHFIHDGYRRLFTTPTAFPNSEHGLQIISDMERRLGLALDLIHSNAVRNFDEGEAMGEVDIKYALDSKLGG